MKQFAILFTLLLAPLTPARAQSQTGASGQTTFNVKRDVPYAEPADPRQKVDIYAPEGARNLPVVFWIHGGGWEAGDRTKVQVKPQAFVNEGFVFVSTGYRLLPDVEMIEIFRDVAKSVRWVHDHIATHGGDRKRLFVMGHSAGAQLAALLCTDDRYLKAEKLSLEIVKGCVPNTLLNRKRKVSPHTVGRTIIRKLCSFALVVSPGNANVRLGWRIAVPVGYVPCATPAHVVTQPDWPPPRPL